MQAKRMLESFRAGAGNTPCDTCASMKLTEDKFIISEPSKHRRPYRVMAVSGQQIHTRLGSEGLGFGPHEFRLGNLGELFARRSECPFCGLAVTSLNPQYKSFVQDTNAGLSIYESDFYNETVTCFVSMYDTSIISSLYCPSYFSLSLKLVYEN
jgi:hypothetical protein